MNAQTIERRFAKIGARAVVRAEDRPVGRGLRLDVARDRQGEYFDVALSKTVSEIAVLDVRPQLRHLLLASVEKGERHRFLCGHDERHWFVAAVPGPAMKVADAFDSLKPSDVHLREQRLGVKPRKRNRRRNEAFLRQGEWFFMPIADGARVDETLIYRNEPIARGGGKPHRCEELVRDGGELVYVSSRFPQGLSANRHRKLIHGNPELRNLDWTPRRRNPQVFVRGKIRHPDHKTIYLLGWHQVLMNTETQSASMRHVAFID